MRTASPVLARPGNPSVRPSASHAAGQSLTIGPAAVSPIAVRRAKWLRYSISVEKYSAPPFVIASNSSAQSSPGRNPVVTSRSDVLPPSRPSIKKSKAMNRPSGSGGAPYANRCPGSDAVIGCSGVHSPNAVRTTPLATSLLPMNQESMPGPVAIAFHTSSTFASTLASSVCENSYPISSHLALGEERGQHGRDGGGLDLVVLARQRRPAASSDGGGDGVLTVRHPRLALAADADPRRCVDGAERLRELVRQAVARERVAHHGVVVAQRRRDCLELPPRGHRSHD